MTEALYSSPWYKKNAHDAAVLWLRGILQAGPVAVTEIARRAALAEQFGERTLRAAKAALGAKARRINGAWEWHL